MRTIKMFEIIYANLSRNITQSEQGGIRPVIVIQNDVGNKFSPTIRDYDTSKSFDGFLYSCLYKKFCSEMTRRRREKRKADRMSISIDTPIGDDENTTIGDLLADGKTVERELFEEKKEWRKEVNEYLNSLSPLQRVLSELWV